MRPSALKRREADRLSPCNAIQARVGLSAAGMPTTSTILYQHLQIDLLVISVELRR
jgi:hypothetical protein